MHWSYVFLALTHRYEDMFLCSNILRQFIEMYTELGLSLGLFSVSAKTSYHKTSWSLEAARLVVWINTLLGNLMVTMAAVQPWCLSNFRVMKQFEIQISQLQDFARSYNKMSYWILKQGLGGHCFDHCAVILQRSQISVTHLNISHLEIKSLSPQSSNELQWLDKDEKTPRQ